MKVLGAFDSLLLVRVLRLPDTTERRGRGRLPLRVEVKHGCCHPFYTHLAPGLRTAAKDKQPPARHHDVCLMLQHNRPAAVTKLRHFIQQNCEESLQGSSRANLRHLYHVLDEPASGLIGAKIFGEAIHESPQFWMVVRFRGLVSGA